MAIIAIFMIERSGYLSYSAIMAIHISYFGYFSMNSHTSSQ